VPITGRKAFNIFPATWDEEIGAQAYQDQVLSQANLVTSGSQLQMVRRVMQRLVAVAQPDVDAPYDWAVNLIQDDKTANAFALPGGKMAVYTGILPITQDEAGLAVVMGHEIGHVVARHGAQRMTQATGIDSLFQLWDAGKLEPLARLAVQYGVELPYSRENESEADHIGLIYLARAGYDPHEAIAFWKRMEAAGGSQPPEFLSTHPSHETRIKDLEGWMPEAEKAYRKATAAP